MKAIIVDDEALARRRLSGLLSELEGATVCGSFGAAAEALDYIEMNSVDVVFLDISMPEMDGMELANRLLDRDSTVQFVFVTGYEEYAVAAFELDVADYLLKPVSRERLAKTMGRLNGLVRQRVQRLKVSCFGGFSAITENGDVIRWRSPKVEELFAFLICKRKATRDEIADTLWNELAPNRAMRNINSTLYYIRKALQLYGLEGCIATRQRHIIIDAEKISCDLYEFEAMQRQRQISEEAWERIDTLYTGELFQGMTYEWSFAIARGLERSFLSSLLKAARLRAEQDRQPEAEALYLRAVELDYCEEAYQQLMIIYRESGQTHRADRLQKQMNQLLAPDGPGVSCP